MEVTFVVFAHSTYYPEGGWQDVKSFHRTLDSAKEALEKLDEDEGHIVKIHPHGDMDVVYFQPSKY